MLVVLQKQLILDHELACTILMGESGAALFGAIRARALHTDFTT